MQLPDWAYLASVGGAIVALMALIVTIVIHLANARKERGREWQRVAVFDILANGPLSLKDIDVEYGLLVRGKSDMPLREMTTQALKRELLKLVADGVVQRNPDESYALRVETQSDLRDALMEAVIQGSKARDRMMTAEHWIVELVRVKPGQLTEKEILFELSRAPDINLPQHEQGYLLRSMEARNVIERSDKGQFTVGVPGKTKVLKTTRTVYRRTRPFKDRANDAEQ